MVPHDESDLSPVMIRVGEMDVGFVPLWYLGEILSWIRAGLELRTSVRVEDGTATLRILLVPEDD